MRTATIRLLLVPLGLILAWCAGFAVAAVAIYRDTPQLAAQHGLLPEDLIFFSLPVVMLTGPGFLAAGLAFALIGEALRLRSWVYYVLTGGIVTALGCRVMTLSGENGLFGDEVSLAAGFAAGFLYWLVAGRSAGLVARA